MREGALNFRDGDLQTEYLQEALEILMPELKEGENKLYQMIRKHKLGDELMNYCRYTAQEAAYVVGLISGLHVVGRADIVPALAKQYSEKTVEADFTDYNDDGGYK